MKHIILSVWGLMSVALAYSQGIEDSDIRLSDTLTFDGPEHIATVASLDSIEEGSVITEIDKGAVYLVEISKDYGGLKRQGLAVKNKQQVFDLYYLRPWPDINGYTRVDSMAWVDFNGDSHPELVLYFKHSNYLTSMGGGFHYSSYWVQVWDLETLDILFTYPVDYCNVDSPPRFAMSDEGDGEATEKEPVVQGGTCVISILNKQITITEQPSHCTDPPIIKKQYQTVTYQYTPVGFVAIKRSMH